MNGFLQRLKQSKLVQWTAAYVAFAFALIQVLDAVSDSYDWPHAVMHITLGVLAIGFVVALLLAWYHGERGAQRISGPELLLIAMALAIGGGAVWHFSRLPGKNTETVISTQGARASTVPATAKASAEALPALSAITQPISAKSVAVLPFENLSADRNNAYFADGMQDLILTKLADIGDLKVISRTSTMKYASHPDDLKTIGQQLGVATILEGSVQKAGNQVLINVQLIDARTDSHIWAQSYERKLDNIFGVEGEVAEKVAKSLNATLTAEESTAVARTLTTNPQAYTLYLKAQYEVDQYVGSDGQPEHLLRADNDLHEAIQRDPRFAAAYAALARTELLLTAGAVTGARDATLEDVRAHAEKAIALQPDLAAPHITMSRVLMDADSDLPGALREMHIAAHLSPNSAFLQSRFAVLHVMLGDWNQAIRDAENALHLDPRRGANYDECALLYFELRRYDDAVQVLQRGLAISPDDQFLRSDLGGMYLRLGKLAMARAQLEMLPATARNSQARVFIAWLWSRIYPAALEAAKLTPQRSVWIDAGLRDLRIGMAATLMGDRQMATTALEQARKEVLAVSKQHGNALLWQLSRIEMWSDRRQAAMEVSDKELSLAAQTRAKTKWGSNGPPSEVENAPGVYENRAEILAHFGDANGAVRILNQLFEAKGTGWTITVPQLKLDPVWDPIRHDPRFQALLRRYGKSPANASTAAAP